VKFVTGYETNVLLCNRLCQHHLLNTISMFNDVPRLLILSALLLGLLLELVTILCTGWFAKKWLHSDVKHCPIGV